MEWGVGLALYGAILSTSLATLEFFRWIRENRFIIVHTIWYWSPDEKEIEHEVTVMNRATNPVTLLEFSIASFKHNFLGVRTKHLLQSWSVNPSNSGKLPCTLQPGEVKEFRFSAIDAYLQKQRFFEMNKKLSANSIRNDVSRGRQYILIRHS